MTAAAASADPPHPPASFTSKYVRRCLLSLLHPSLHTSRRETHPGEANNRNDSRCMTCVPSEIPQGPEVGPYQPLEPHGCQRCHQSGPAQPKSCQNDHSDATGPEGGAVGQTADCYDSGHQLSCHEAVQCHWLQGSKGSGTEKLPQRPVATGRSVQTGESVFSLSKCVFILILMYLQGRRLLLHAETVSAAN